MSDNMKFNLINSFLLCWAVVLSGCVAAERQMLESTEELEPTIVFRPANSSYVLSCLQDLDRIKDKEFNLYFEAAKARLKKGTDEDQLRFICLSLNVNANYEQFKQGTDVLELYIKEHPDSREEMSGLLGLVGRLDQAKVSRWTSRKKMLDEKEELENEVARLQAEVETLQAQAEQDKLRIQELRNQIEQLKNIENIIKNREHGS